jgi:hypothetical protein
VREPLHVPEERREPVHVSEGVPAPTVHVPERVREPQAAPAPVRQEAQPVREPDPVEIERALRDSGLEMVQTRASGPIELPPDAEFVPAKRERRPPPSDINEPLVQVETGQPPEPKP